MLQQGQPAPAFSLPNQNNDMISLADFKDKKNVVLYFYPKDDTPGCTIEANQFTALIEPFAQMDTVILGVSKDGCDSHRAFIDKFGLKMDLLTDSTGEVCENYDVWRERKKWYGASKMGILRSTFVINKQGELAYCEYGVTADGHAQAVLEIIKKL